MRRPREPIRKNGRELLLGIWFAEVVIVGQKRLAPLESFLPSGIRLIELSYQKKLTKRDSENPSDPHKRGKMWNHVPQDEHDNTHVDQ